MFWNKKKKDPELDRNDGDNADSIPDTEKCTDENNSRFRPKTGSVILTVLLVFAVVFCLYASVQTLSKGYVSLGRFSFFRVVTGSMEPTIPVGSLILSEKESIENIETEDVICFHAMMTNMQGQIITHRVVQKTVSESGQINLHTKGDANTVADGYYVNESNFIGKVIWVSGQSNFFANLVTFFTSSIGFLACIAFPLLLIIGITLRNSINKMKSDMSRILDILDDTSKQNDISEAKQGNGNPDPEVSVRDSRDALSAPSDGISEEYREMYERIRAELIEELKQGDQKEQGEK